MAPEGPRVIIQRDNVLPPLSLPSRLLLCFMCCTTMLSMWLSNTSTTAMVMPIVEAVLQELINAEEEQLVAGNPSTEEAELMGAVHWGSPSLCSAPSPHPTPAFPASLPLGHCPTWCPSPPLYSSLLAMPAA